MSQLSQQLLDKLQLLKSMDYTLSLPDDNEKISELRKLLISYNSFLKNVFDEDRIIPAIAPVKHIQRFLKKCYEIDESYFEDVFEYLLEYEYGYDYDDISRLHVVNNTIFSMIDDFNYDDDDDY